jgi:Cd2+/Zn2+-exporting ATPase
MVDASMLTGESVPVPVGPGDEVFGGTVNQAGELRVQVTRPAGDSAASRMLTLVEDAVGRKAKTEQFITRFAKVYTPVMVGLALVVAVFPPLLLSGQTFQDWIYRALIVLVISCPCALVISIPLGYFGGIGAASRRGILVKGANFLDVLAQVRTVVFDKTGTLTKGAFWVVEIMPVEGLSENELLALAARAEGNSTHPLASAVRAAYRKQAGADQDFSEDSVEELAGFGRRVDVGGQVILIGNDAILHRENVPHPACDVDGTVMFIAVDGEYQGYLRVDDELKAEASQAINSLRASGVRHISMLSGDHAATAGRVAKAVGLDDFQAELLPSEKVSQLEEIIARSSDGTVAFVGDGINDAAGLARADVGIAMGALGTDAAREAADVVLVTDEISRIAEAISLARRTRRIVWQNIGLALGIKLVFILLGVAGSASMWEAVFADVGVTILAVLNSIRVLRN